jgi:hypothetical protein
MHGMLIQLNILLLIPIILLAANTFLYVMKHQN